MFLAFLQESFSKLCKPVLANCDGWIASISHTHKKIPNSGQIVATTLATSETLRILVQHSEFLAGVP